MKKWYQIFLLSSLCLFSYVCVAQEAVQNGTNEIQAKNQVNGIAISCYDFLKNTIVEDQLYEEFGEHSDLDVKMDPVKNYCTLTITTPNQKVYEFSSISPKNFVYEDKNLALFLYEKSQPKIENVIEADYEYNQIIDVASDFPILNDKDISDDDNE